jgi:hypothetical protein
LTNLIWIAGTSGSIEIGGYVSRLSICAAERGYALRNLSVGDETSLMGCIRVLSHQQSISQGDVLIWEYSLLDALLGPNFVHSDVRDARRMAWDTVLSKGGHVIVVMVPPRPGMKRLTRHERETLADASARGQLAIDVRDLFEKLEIKHPKLEYRDDRHLSHNTPVLTLLVEKLISAIGERHGSHEPKFFTNEASGVRAATKAPLTWIEPEQFCGLAHGSLRTLSNSLLSLRVREIRRTDVVVLGAAATRCAYVGVISRPNSGAIWCGHDNCPAVATALPTDTPHNFLARTIQLPCQRRAKTLSISSRNEASLRTSYGTRRCVGDGVEIFGLLCDFSVSLRPDRHLHRFTMALRRMRSRVISSVKAIIRSRSSKARNEKT